jgi:hypothetical protein
MKKSFFPSGAKNGTSSSNLPEKGAVRGAVQRPFSLVIMVMMPVE